MCVSGALEGKEGTAENHVFFHLSSILMNIGTLRKDFRCLLSFSNPIFPCISSLKHIFTQTHGECRLQRKKLEHQNKPQKARTCHMAERTEDRTFMWWQYFSRMETLAALFINSLFMPSAPRTAHTSKEVKWIRTDSSWPVNHWTHPNLYWFTTESLFQRIRNKPRFF